MFKGSVLNDVRLKYTGCKGSIAEYADLNSSEPILYKSDYDLTWEGYSAGSSHYPKNCCAGIARNPKNCCAGIARNRSQVEKSN